MKDKNLLISNGINVDASLEFFGDMQTYNDTLLEYMNGVNEKMNELKKYKEMSDTYNYAIIAHSLKSDSKYLGFTSLAEICFSHEKAGKANDITFVYNDFDNLINEVKRINNVVNQYLGNEVIETVPEQVKTPTNNKAILVVDDSDIITGYVKKIFANEYETIIATDGAKAIDAINNDLEGKIIGMLLDLNLPNVNGFEVLEYFNKNNLFTKIPVTVVTGSDSATDVQKVFSYPVVDILNKPFNERDLKNTLEKMFNK